MGKNQSRKIQRAVRFLNWVLQIEADSEGALPGSVLQKVKEARKILNQNIRKCRDAKNENSNGKVSLPKGLVWCLAIMLLALWVSVGILLWEIVNHDSER